MSSPLEDDALDDVDRELSLARAKHPAMHNAHEAYGVICEEVDEFWLEVKKQERNPAAMRRELLHVAAMAVGAIEDLGLNA